MLNFSNLKILLTAIDREKEYDKIFRYLII